jgi:proton-dependent oligopeptide transporter, POT family
MTENTSASTLPKKEGFPRGVPFIIGNEAAERFSYYGMLSILTIYLSKGLKLGDVQGKEIVHIFATAVYFLPLFGAWLADKWLGRYWTILIISLFYCVGHAVLATFEGHLWGVYLGLTLIAIGAGGIKPCVSAFVGDQFGTENEKGLTRVYGWFYWTVNFGAAFGFAVIPMIRDKHGYSWAFGVPGIAMGVATLIFWLGRKHYVRQPPARQSRQAGVVSVVTFAFKNQRERKAGQKFLDVALAKFSAEEVNAVRAVGRIALIFLTVPVFFALYNQVNSTWVLQGEQMTPFEILGFKMDGERMQAVGSILVMIWVPIMTYLIYPLFEKIGLRPTPLRRIAVGMVLAAVTYIISAMLQTRIDIWLADAAMKYDAATSALNPNGPLGPPYLHLIPPPSLAWQLMPYIVLVAGEVLVSATGLEYAFEEAPRSMRSIIMSFWLLTIAGGHFLIALFTYLNEKFVQASGAKELYAYAVLMFVVSIVFMFIAMTVGRKRPRTNSLKSGSRD